MKTNLRVKQQRYTMTRSKIRRGLLPNIQPIVLFRERGKKVDYRYKTFDDFSLMIIDPPPKMNSEKSDIISRCFVTSRENQSSEVMSKMLLNDLLKRREESKTPSHTRFSAMTAPEKISLKVFWIILK